MRVRYWLESKLFKQMPLGGLGKQAMRACGCNETVSANNPRPDPSYSLPTIQDLTPPIHDPSYSQPLATTEQTVAGTCRTLWVWNRHLCHFFPLEPVVRRTL